MPDFAMISTVGNALKTYYTGPIIVQIDEQVGPVYTKIEKRIKEVAGNQFKWPLQYGRSGGVGARSEGGNLPNPSPRSYLQAAAIPKDMYARMAISDKLMRTSKISKASFADQLTLQMQDLTGDAKDMLRRNFCNDSTGVMGKVDANVTGAKNVVVKEGNIKWFYPGQRLDVLTAPATKSVDGVVLADVDYATNTIVFASNVTVTANQIITLAGNYNNELVGLGEIFTADTTIYGINRADYSWFNPMLYPKNAAFDSMFLQEGIDDIRDYTGDEVDFIVCNSRSQRTYVDEQNTYKHNVNTMTVDGGFKVVTYNGIPFSVEPYYKDGIYDLLTTKNIHLDRLAEWDWMDDDGKILSRIAEKAAYEASMVCYEEMTCDKIRAQARISGVTMI